MAEVININHERLLARTLALRACRCLVLEYRNACRDFGKSQLEADEAEDLTKLLHQIDEALK